MMQINKITRFCGNVKTFCSIKCVRSLSNTNVHNTNSNHHTKFAIEDKMETWQIHSYGGLEELQLTQKARIPIISNPGDVLVKVHAASLNPIDVAMLGGYGATMLNLMRMGDLEFPLTLGRDFSGVVVGVGQEVKNYIKPGDIVWGVVPVQRQGCHADYVLVNQDCVSIKPKSLNTLEASCVLYAGLTAWSAFWGCPTIKCNNSVKEKKILVLGGSGGVGSLAIQMLSAEGAEVFTTCSADAIENVEKIGASCVLNYISPTFQADVVSAGPYDTILDCAGIRPNGADMYPWRFKNYVTLSSPLLRNVDNHGLVRGMANNIQSYLEPNLKSFQKEGGLVQWAYFQPSAEGIKYLGKLVDNGKLTSVIERVYNFSETPEAYSRVLEGHLRGKIVIEMDSNKLL